MSGHLPSRAFSQEELDSMSGSVDRSATSHRSPSDTNPSRLMQPYPGFSQNYQPYIPTGFEDMFTVMSPPGPGAQDLNVNGFATPEFLTDRASDPDFPRNNGANAAFPFSSNLQPPEYQGMHPTYPMQPPFRCEGSSHFHHDDSQQIPVFDLHRGQEVVPVSNMGFPSIPPTYSPNSMSGPVFNEQHFDYNAHIDDHSGSSGNGDSSRPTSIQLPQVQRLMSGNFQNFIDDNPVLNTAYSLAKGKVASYPIVKASSARRKNPAPYVCEHCQATFTRAHNLCYHKDAHFGIKKYTSFCDKKFGTLSGLKRHYNTCPKCREASTLPPP